MKLTVFGFQAKHIEITAEESLSTRNEGKPLNFLFLLITSKSFESVCLVFVCQNVTILF